MKLQNIILEARKNPQSNPKISINSQIEQHYKNAPVLKYGVKNSFVSFSELEMLAGGNRFYRGGGPFEYIVILLILY